MFNYIKGRGHPLPLCFFIRMRKKYISNTCLSLNVALEGGGNKRVSFDCHSNGKSSYITEDTQVQKGLERHAHYGRLFFVDSDYEESCVREESLAPVVQEEERMKVITVSDLSEAKNYLVDTFEISRTLLRSKASIVEHGRSHGIVFEGI